MNTINITPSSLAFKGSIPLRVRDFINSQLTPEQLAKLKELADKYDYTVIMQNGVGFNHTTTFDVDNPAILDFFTARLLAKANNLEIDKYPTANPSCNFYRIRNSKPNGETIDAGYTVNPKSHLNEATIIWTVPVEVTHYDYDKNECSKSMEYRTIKFDNDGNYFANEETTEPTRKFDNIDEMLAFCKQEITRPEPEKQLIGIRRFLNDIRTENYENVKFDKTDANYKEKLVKTVQNRTNAKLSVFGPLSTLIALPPMLSGYGVLASIGAAIICGLVSGISIGNSYLCLKDKIKLLKSPLYKEYKASLPENTGIMQRTIKVLQKPMRMIKK